MGQNQLAAVAALSVALWLGVAHGQSPVAAPDPSPWRFSGLIGGFTPGTAHDHFDSNSSIEREMTGGVLLHGGVDLTVMPHLALTSYVLFGVADVFDFGPTVATGVGLGAKLAFGDPHGFQIRPWLAAGWQRLEASLSLDVTGIGATGGLEVRFPGQSRTHLMMRIGFWGQPWSNELTFAPRLLIQAGVEYGR